MIEGIDVCALLKEYDAFSDVAIERLLTSSCRALALVKRNLKENVDENDPLILETAAALARFDLFRLMLGETDRFASYRAGDVTIQKDILKEFRIEKELRDEALANASGILKDGGFYFSCE